MSNRFLGNARTRTAFVTLAADETMGIVDLEARKLTRKIEVAQAPDGVWYGPAPR